MVDLTFEEAISKCVATIQCGGLIVIPTDSGTEIAVNPFCNGALTRLLALMPSGVPIRGTVMLADARDILTYVAAPPPDIIAVVGSFATPTAVMFDGVLELPGAIAHASGRTAFRVPKLLICRALVKRLGHPLFSVPLVSGGLTNFEMAFNEESGNAYRVTNILVESLLPVEFVRVTDDGEVLNVMI